MNHQIYLFGSIGSSYFQYPDDFAKSFIRLASSDLEAATQIALRREGNLIYYTYYRKLLGGDKKDSYIGLSVCFNGVFCQDVNTLFGAFEKYITELAVSGRFIEFSNDGDLLPKSSSFFIQQEDIEKAKGAISGIIDRLPVSSFKKLPPINFGAENDSIIKCRLEDSDSTLADLLKEVNYVVILKDQNYKTAQFVGFSKQLSDLFQSNQLLLQKNSELEKQVGVLNKQKKQYKVVIALSIIAFLALVAIALFGKSILNLQVEVKNKDELLGIKEERIEALKGDISKKDATIKKLNSSLIEKDELISQRDSFMVSFSSNTVCPIAISNIEVRDASVDYGDTIYSSNTTYIYSRLTAYSLIGGSIDIYVKFYTPYGISTNSNSPSGYSYTSSITLNKNTRTTVFVTGWGSANKGHWANGQYRIEYWYNDVCLGKKSFSIY